MYNLVLLFSYCTSSTQRWSVSPESAGRRLALAPPSSCTRAVHTVNIKSPLDGITSGNYRQQRGFQVAAAPLSCCTHAVQYR